MNFQPDRNLPDCMTPDGGKCCAGYTTLCTDWHKQRDVMDEANTALGVASTLLDAQRERIAKLEAALREALERRP